MRVISSANGHLDRRPEACAQIEDHRAWARRLDDGTEAQAFLRLSLTSPPTPSRLPPTTEAAIFWPNTRPFPTSEAVRDEIPRISVAVYSGPKAGAP